MSEREPSASRNGPPRSGPQFEFVTRRPSEERKSLFQSLRAFARKESWPSAVANEVELIFEEWITDVLDYGVNAVAEPFFKVQIFCDQPLARIVVTDNGIPFDPLSVPAPDVRLPADQRQIGGLGIFMMRNLAASMSHERRGSQNVLTIRKSLREPMLRSAKVA